MYFRKKIRLFFLSNENTKDLKYHFILILILIYVLKIGYFLSVFNLKVIRHVAHYKRYLKRESVLAQFMRYHSLSRQG